MIFYILTLYTFLKIFNRKTFVRNEKCIFYDNKFTYIFDTTHSSYKGSNLINDLIIKEIEQIETK